MDFKRRISEVEETVVMYSFHTTWVRSATFMNTKIAEGTKIEHITFFATKIASELHQCDLMGAHGLQILW